MLVEGRGGDQQKLLFAVPHGESGLNKGPRVGHFTAFSGAAKNGLGLKCRVHKVLIIKTLAPFVPNGMTESMAAPVPDFQPLIPSSSLSIRGVLGQVITVVEVRRGKEGPGVRCCRG